MALLHRVVASLSILVLAIVVTSVAGNGPTGHSCPSLPTPVNIPFLGLNKNIVNAFDTIDTNIQAFIDKAKIPGFVGTVVYDQEQIWTNGFGVKSPFSSDNSTVDGDTIFRLCSITKVFTDIMLYKMRDAGLVNMHDPVQKFIPSYSVINPYNVTGVNTTLHQLANQNSGLAREVPCPYEDQSKCSGEYILDQVRKQYLVYPPNTHPHYSNLGFSLLGRTLQVAAGQKYEDYVLDEITTPLGMLSTGFNYTESVMDRLAIGSLLSKNNSLIPAQITPLGWGTPAGGLYSTANDMAKFISGFFFNQSNPDAILSATSVNEMTGYSFNLQDGVSAFGSPFEMYYNNSLWYVMKAGGYTGYRAELLLVPSLKLGIFTAGSSEYQGGDDSLFTLEIAKTILPVLTQIISESQPSAHLPPSWKSYVGSYTWFSDAYYDTITNLTVAVNEDMTTLNATAVYSNGGNAFQGTLTYFLGDTFRITFPVDGTDCRFFDDGLEGEFFTFSPPLNGGLSDSVFLMGNTYNRTSA